MKSHPNFFTKACVITALLFFICYYHLAAQNKPDKLSVKRNTVDRIARTTATLQVVENPMIRNSSHIHKRPFRALKKTGSENEKYLKLFYQTHQKMWVCQV